tara:strand:+ start:281 stop:460 length:180 start_codon:yes stop_codon:yes gene_type:complete
MFFVTAGNTKNPFKTQESARVWFDAVCAAGNGHVFFWQELPAYKVIAERNPITTNKETN